MAYTSLSGKKLRAKLVGTLNESASAPTSEFAKKQLEKMGWSEGSGLGKHGQGIQTHIKVKKRENDVGLGHRVHPHGNNNNSSNNMWWADACGDTLSRLSKQPKKVMTDQDLFDATGGARFGMRAQRKQTGKWARAEKKDHRAEEEAKTKVEWNGTGAAKVVLSQDKKRITTTTTTDDDEQPKLKKLKREGAKSDSSHEMEKPKKSNKVKQSASSDDEEGLKKKKAKREKRNEESGAAGAAPKKTKKEKKAKKEKKRISNE